jgi:CHAT domain-containing protein
LIEDWLAGRRHNLRLSDLDEALFTTLEGMIANLDPADPAADRLRQLKTQFFDLKRALYKVAAEMETNVDNTDIRPLRQLEQGRDEELRVAARFIRAAKGPHASRAYQNAEPRYYRATDLIGMNLGTKHPAYRACLANLRQMRLAMGNLVGGGIPVGERPDEPFEREEDERTYATWMEYFAELYLQAHDYASAAQILYLHRRWSRSLFLEPRQRATFAERLAKVCARAGKYASAYREWHQALEIYTTLSARGEDSARCAAELGRFLSEELQYHREAGPLLRNSLEIYQELYGNSDPRAIYVHSGLVRLYLAQNDPERAQLHFKECHRAGDQIQERRLVGRLAHHILRQPRPKNDPVAQDVLLTAALLADATGNSAEAERRFNELLNSQVQRYDWGNLSVAQTLFYFGQVLHREGAIVDARQCYETCLKIREGLLGSRHRDLAPVQQNLAIICVEQDQPETALELLRAAAHSDSRHMGETLAIGSEQYRAECLTRMKRRVDMLLTLAVDYLNLEQLNAEAEAQFAERRQRQDGSLQYQRLSNILYNLILRRKGLNEAVERRIHGDIRRGDLVSSEHTAELMQRLDTIHSQLAQIGILVVLGGGRVVDNEIEALLNEKERLESALVRLTPSWSVDEILEHEDATSASMGLPPDSALVEFVQFEPFPFQSALSKDQVPMMPARYLAFVLHAQSPLYCELIHLGDAEQIDNLIRAFRREISRGGGASVTGRDLVEDVAVEATDAEVAGEQLRRAVFDPLLEKLEGRKRLVISTDGELSTLPFEALPTGDGRHLIDTYLVSYAISGREPIRFGTVSDGRHSTAPLIIGAPNYNLGSELADEQALDHKTPLPVRGANYRFNSLEGTRLEVAEVASKLMTVGQRPELLTGDDALESKVKDCKHPRILHIASHGFVVSVGGGIGTPLQPLRDLPLTRAGLALGGANTVFQGKMTASRAEDGILTAEDVLTMNLRGTELVILSACETGLGEVRVGEGVLGMQRAFRVAGAWSLVMSLWKVPDQATYALIVAFYDQLLKGVSRAEALRNAQLIIKSTHPAPLYWAGFICHGLPGPMTFDPATGEQSDASTK